MIDLGGPPSPNHAWHDELFRGWRPDYPDPAPPVPIAPPVEDGLLFQPGPLYPDGKPEPAAPLLPGAQESGGDVYGHGYDGPDSEAARHSMLGPPRHPDHAARLGLGYP